MFQNNMSSDQPIMGDTAALSSGAGVEITSLTAHGNESWLELVRNAVPEHGRREPSMPLGLFGGDVTSLGDKDGEAWVRTCRLLLGEDYPWGTCFATLHTLALVSCRLTERHASDLALVVRRQCLSLRRLILDDNELRDEGLTALVSAVTGRKLKPVLPRIYDEQDDDDDDDRTGASPTADDDTFGGARGCDARPPPCALEELHLASNGLFKHSAVALSVLLGDEAFPALRVLNCNDNYIGQGALMVADTLAINGTLLCLGLQDNTLKAAFVPRMLLALQTNTSLLELDCDVNGFEEADLEQIESELSRRRPADYEDIERTRAVVTVTVTHYE